MTLCCCERLKTRTKTNKTNKVEKKIPPPLLTLTHTN